MNISLHSTRAARNRCGPAINQRLTPFGTKFGAGDAEPMDADEDTVVGFLRQGNAAQRNQAFQWLDKALCPMKFWLAKRLESFHDAEEIIQETHLSILRKLSYFHGERGEELLRWAKVVAKRHYIDKFREINHLKKVFPRESINIATDKGREYSLTQSDDRLLDHAPEDPAEIVRREEDKKLYEDKVKGKLNALSPEKQELFHLHLEEGLSFPEIVSRIGGKATTLARRYEREIQKLRDAMRPEDNPQRD